MLGHRVGAAQGECGECEPVTLEGEAAEACLPAYFLAPGSLDGKSEQYTSLINAKPQSPFSIRTCL